MPYTLYKTNGVKLTVIEDGKLNLATDLQLVGKNYAGYGQVVNENFVKLLENFSKSTPPSNPLIGQIWYDSVAKRIKVYTGTKWSQFLPTVISPNRPADLATGEFWFDTSNLKLYIKNGNNFILIGPSSGAGSGLGTTTILADTSIEYQAIKLTVGDETPAVISAFSYNVDATDPIQTTYTKIKNGITLKDADPVTGVSSTNGSYFWGTSADTVRFNGLTADNYVLTTDVNIITNNITQLNNLTRISTGSPSILGFIEGTWLLEPGSTLQATYSDLAERYEADDYYEPGTVLMLGGEKEVTICTEKFSTAVAGVVSTNPAYMLNSAAGNNFTHPYIALSGRIPCKVVGGISKGDLLVASGIPGVAQSVGDEPVNPNAVIGKALENYSSNEVGLIEIKV